MKKASTQQPTSGTQPNSYLAAAAKQHNKANSATPPSSSNQQSQQQSQQQQNSQQAGVSSSSNSSAPVSQTQSSTATTSSSGNQGAAASNNSQNPSKPQSQQSASKPAAPANGNYAVAVKANNAPNRRSQVPSTTAAAVKGAQPGKPTAAAVVASGSSTSSIRFGSINEPESGSSATTVTESAPASQTTSTGMTFGSIATSQTIPTKQEEAPVAAAPVAAPQELSQPVSQAPEQINSFKPNSHNAPQGHRRTDSTSSSHANEQSHYRGQGLPQGSQQPMMPGMGHYRPPKGQHLPLNPPPMHMQQHHQHQQPNWVYMGYDPNMYQGPMYQQPYMGGQPRMQRPPYSSPHPATTGYSAPVASNPPQPRRAITIKTPDGAPVQLPTFNTTAAADVKTQKAPSVSEVKKPDEDNKFDYIKPSTGKSAIRIVKPQEKEEKEEKERLEKEQKEAEEKRVREEQAEKERLEAVARAEQERAEKEERERVEKEELERKEREERERKEQEERELKEKEERERKEQEEREHKEKEERERKEQEERERKEREERELKEREEKERIEKERAEADRKRKEEEERIAREKAEAEKIRIEKEKTEQEAKDKVEAERRAALEKEKLKEEPAKPEAQANDSAASTEVKPSAVDSTKLGLTVDLSRTASAPSPMLSARIENFNAVSYPSHIQSPGNSDVQGKFRYDRDFLMQFMNVCTDKPDSLPSLDVLGGDGNDRNMQSPGGPRGGARGPINNGRPKPAQMGSFNLGGMKLNSGMPMGMRNPSTDNRLHRTNSDNSFLPRNNNLSRPPSQRGSRGGKRGGGGGGGRDNRNHQEPALTIPLADIVPLEKTENAWTPNVNANADVATLVAADEVISQETVARKVKGLLNKLTLEKFESISDKVIEIANFSAKESDGTTLRHCIQIIFEKATDEPNFGGVYAMLCQKMMEKISPDVKDVSVEGSTGGKLFRKYLLHRCQEDFMRGWKDKVEGGVSLGDKDGPDLMSDEYYVLMKAKRQGLGLIHFIGELFKLQMLTEKIMHECVKKLLSNVKDPEEEETEGLCKLMTTVGLQLDRPEAKNHMDVYFVRMTELTKNNKLPSRIRFMVQDVIDLRASKWVNRRAASGPKTIAAIHEEAARQQEEKEMMRRTASSGGGRGLPNRREQLNRVQSFRGSGDARHDMGGVPQVGADGWSTVPGGPVMTKKAGDLSSFGNTSRSKVSGVPSLGPAASVFGSLNKGKRGGDKAVVQNDTSRLSSTNIFAALEGDGASEKPTERKRLNLAPRSVPLPATETPAESKPESGAPKKTEDEAKRSIDNTLKEFLSLRDMTELLISVKELDTCYKPLLVTEFVNQSMEMKQPGVDSIGEIFKKLIEEKVLSSEDFETGFADPLEFLPDTAIDVPSAYKYAAQLLEAAGMDPSRAAKP
ncbi:hypothetical protein BGZ76_011570 [Entomortierella beljakovae]|nr:hypothetical protein BGZ76_011570 [Entomortierella beljakovae]